MGNLTAVSTIFCSCIESNLTAVFFFSNGKSKRCFNTFLAWHCRQSTRHFNSFPKLKISALFQEDFGLTLYVICPLFQFFCQMKNVTVVSAIFWPSIAGNLSVVSIFF